MPGCGFQVVFHFDVRLSEMLRKRKKGEGGVERGMEGGGRDGEGLRDGVLEGGERWGGGNLATRLGKVHDQVLGHSDVRLLVLGHTTTVGVIIPTRWSGQISPR